MGRRRRRKLAHDSREDAADIMINKTLFPSVSGIVQAIHESETQERKHEASEREGVRREKTRFQGQGLESGMMVCETLV